MPRYLVERTFVDGVPISADSDGAERCRSVVNRSAAFGVTWMHSYVSSNNTVTYCLCDGPSPEAIRMAAEVSNLSVDKITEVRVLDPYFYH